MKRSLLIALALFVTAQAHAQGKNSLQSEAQRSRRASNLTVSMQPLNLIGGGLAGEVEVPFTNKISIIGGGMYMPSRSNTSSDKNSVTYNVQAYEAYAGAKFMLTGQNNESGFYASPSLGYFSMTLSEYGKERLSGSISAPELRALAGYQWALQSRFRFTAGLGLRSLQTSDIIVKDSSSNEVYREKASLSGTALDLGFGYMF